MDNLRGTFWSDFLWLIFVKSWHGGCRERRNHQSVEQDVSTGRSEGISRAHSVAPSTSTLCLSNAVSLAVDSLIIKRRLKKIYLFSYPNLPLRPDAHNSLHKRLHGSHEDLSTATIAPILRPTGSKTCPAREPWQALKFWFFLCLPAKTSKKRCDRCECLGVCPRPLHKKSGQNQSNHPPPPEIPSRAANHRGFKMCRMTIPFDPKQTGPRKKPVFPSLIIASKGRRRLVTRR